MAEQAFIEYCETRKSSEDIRQCFSRERIKEIKNMLMKKNDAHKPNVYYDYARRYDYQCINGREILIHRHYSTQDKIVEIVPVEEYFQKLTECHEEINHGKREKMMVALRERLYYIYKTLCRKVP